MTGARRDPSNEIARVLSDAYRSPGRHQDMTHSSLADEVSRMLAIYSEKSTVRPLEIVSTDDLGLVLTTETAEVEGQTDTWRSIHLWRIRNGRVERFEAYGQALVVTPPGSIETAR